MFTTYIFLTITKYPAIQIKIILSNLHEKWIKNKQLV